MSKNHYDVIIIGGGLSAIAAGIRLAMFDKKVCILEQHFAPGGLNSYYKRGERLIDVGLHAMTNYAERGEKSKPLTKILKQLRIRYSDLNLSQQNFSKIVYPDLTLMFNNDINFLKNQIYENFPQEIDNFNNFLYFLENYNETSLTKDKFVSAKAVLREKFKSPLLIDMLMFPLLIYGSAWEKDMDFSQFAIMFKSIFLEGFCRPKGGIKPFIDLLINKYKSLGGTIYFKQKVSKINIENQYARSITTRSNETFTAKFILSSIGSPETQSLISIANEVKNKNNDNVELKNLPKAGIMSFCETIMTMPEKPKELQEDASICFYNQASNYSYQNPSSLYDLNSAVICFSNNFEHDDFNEGVVRITNIANSAMWNKLTKEQYLSSKEDLYRQSQKILQAYNPKLTFNSSFHDVFTPKTITRYTSRINGAIYGSPDKVRNGTTQYKNIFICGTDQGFLGIVGSILSGISIVNKHIIQNI